MALSAAISRVNGPVAEAMLPDAFMGELVEVGDDRLPGEVIAIDGGLATIQIYEYTGGLRPGAAVHPTGAPLRAELGPGLVGGVFDGLLRRLSGGPERLAVGVGAATLDLRRPWDFRPVVREGDVVGPGAVLGVVAETAGVEFRLLVPPGGGGPVEWIASGELATGANAARVGGADVGLVQRWPVRTARPVAARHTPSIPLVTGQRVLDLLFPVARGSSAAVPGGFGTGKTVLLQQIAKWCDADVIVYVGCGERGNEMADVLEEFAALTDPRTAQLLLDRTILIANTSNMPVLAREASIYTGVTVAEFFRDMGHNVLLLADSTSRWAEALREVSSRTGELPAEEGYPPGLASALAAFYERAGSVRTLSGADASVTILGAVSPPGGDPTEPVSSQTRRFVRCVWSLDPDLAYARQYPAVSWWDSASRDVESVAAWQAAQGSPGWAARRDRALRLLADAARLESMAELVGVASLPDRERLTLRTARMLRDGVLKQSSLSENDTYCAPAKQEALLDLVLAVHDRCLEMLEAGASAEAIERLDLSAVVRARDDTPADGGAALAETRERVMALIEAAA